MTCPAAVRWASAATSVLATPSLASRAATCVRARAAESSGLLAAWCSAVTVRRAGSFETKLAGSATEPSEAASARTPAEDLSDVEGSVG